MFRRESSLVTLTYWINIHKKQIYRQNTHIGFFTRRAINLMVVNPAGTI